MKFRVEYSGYPSKKPCPEAKEMHRWYRYTYPPELTRLIEARVFRMEGRSHETPESGIWVRETEETWWEVEDDILEFVKKHGSAEVAYVRGCPPNKKVEVGTNKPEEDFWIVDMRRKQ